MAARNTRLFDSRDIVTSNYGGFCMDADGYLWIGTQYGLLRFDGTNFNKYRYDENSEHSLSDNRIIKILRDSDDRIWVATGEGLNLYDPYADNFKRIILPNVDLLGYISDIYQQSNGDIVFMVAGVGLYVLDFSSGEPVAVKFMPQIDISRTVNTLCETRNGELVGGNHNGELIKISPNGQAKLLKVDNSYIRILLADRDGSIFVATPTKAWLWDTSSDTFKEIKVTGRENPLLDNALLTREGDIIVGTDGEGLLKLDRDRSELVPYNEFSNPVIDINNSRISTVYEDSEGNLWFGCSHQGIVMAPATESIFNFVNLMRGLPDYSGGITKVAVIPGYKYLLVGLEDGRLIKVDTESNISTVCKFPGRIRVMKASADNKLFIGIDNNGLFEFNPATGTVQQIVNIKGNYMTPAIAEDKNGNVYLGIHGEGVMKIPSDQSSGNTWLRGNDRNFNPRWVSALFVDSRGRLWIGMYGGLYVYDPATDSYTSVSEIYPSMLKGVQTAIAEDSEGQIWAATSNGLYIIQPDLSSYTRLTSKEGLCDSYVSSVVFDHDGNGWVSTHDGINRVDKHFNVASFYGRNDVADSDYFSAGSTIDGRYLFFSGKRGVTVIEPTVLDHTSPERELAISYIYLNGEKVNGTTVSSGGSKVLSWPDKDHIHISYRDNSLILLLSTNDFRENDNLLYQWRIPGYVNEWVATSTGSGLVNLPHLEPGKHVIELRTMENGLVSPSKKIYVTVDYPWYLTTLAKIFYLIIIIALIVLVARVMRQRNSERINEEKIKFFINISHEIRSPLTLILGPLERIMKKEHDPENLKNLTAIHRNANRILALINQLLDIRKIDKGKMEIQCSETELISFTKDLVDIFQPQAEEKNLNLEFRTKQPDMKEINVWIDRNNFDKVLVNLISNAIKYTPEGGDITVEVGKGVNNTLGDYAEIRVMDTGIGLDEKNLHHLFDRFYQGKFNKGNVPLGFGIGLDLCRMLVELHHGTISASNRGDVSGSCFTVRIPLRHNSKVENPTESDPRIVPSERTRIINMESQGVPVAALTKKSRKNTAISILVVDDDPEIRAYLCDVLSGLGRVNEAVNGEDAMRKVMDSRPDLIISDVVMPSMDGLQLLKTLKANVTTNHIPVILLSSKNDVADRMAGWDKGADGYIGKPFNTQELLSLIDNLIDNRLRLKGKFSGIQEQDDKIETPVLKGNDTVLIDKIVQEINGHLEDPNLNVEKLCQEVGLSRAHLNRKMKELFGLTPSEFIRNIRLRKACELLKQGDIDISQIAYSVGFTSQPHFSTAFKRFSGLSPSEYRQRNSTGPVQSTTETPNDGE